MEHRGITPGELNIADGVAEGKTKPSKSKYWFFTWEPNAKQKKIPDADLLATTLNQFTGYYAFQLERGELKGKLHFQGCFSLKKGRITRKQLLKQFSNQIDNVNGLTLQPQFSFAGSVDYCTKEETRVEGPWIKGDQVLDYLGNKDFILKPWQEVVYNQMVKSRDPINAKTHIAQRGVIYVEDLEGGAGKTSFIKWMCQNRGRFNVYKIPLGKQDRLVSAVAKLKGYDVDAICIDIPRTIANDIDMNGVFHAIEELKGGHVVDTMYGNYREAFFKNLVILITSNIEFNQMLQYMSLDRWYIYQLEKGDGPEREVKLYVPGKSRRSLTPADVFDEVEHADHSEASMQGIENVQFEGLFDEDRFPTGESSETVIPTGESSETDIPKLDD